jgi:diadenosine tetraphosphate (Ap4A) HIT family hydrolase
MSTCKFCALLAEGGLTERLPNLVLETNRAVVAVNRRPLAPGHVTLILKRHHDKTSNLRDTDLTGIGDLAGRIADALERRYQPHRVVFLGDGKPSAHLHFHLIPEPAGAPLDPGSIVSDLNLTPRPNTLNDADTAALVETLRSSLGS